MNWIKEHMRLAVSLTIVIALMAVVGISSSRNGTLTGVGKAVNGAVAVSGEPLSDAGNGISSLFSGLIHFRDNQRENYKLKQEVADLTEKLTKASLDRLEYEDLQKLQKSLDYESFDDGYKAVTADVAASGGSDIFSTYTINKGKSSGIEKDDMVVSPDGLVGRVADMGGGWSKVVSIVDSSNSVSFTVPDKPEIVGVVSGNGRGGLSGYLFDDRSKLDKGDTIVTSGRGFYPPGIKIGTVTSVKINKNTRKKEIRAIPSVNMDSVRMVTVLTGERKIKDSDGDNAADVKESR